MAGHASSPRRQILDIAEPLEKRQVFKHAEHNCPCILTAEFVKRRLHAHLQDYLCDCVGGGFSNLPLYLRNAFLDEWRAKQKPIPSRAEAIRRLVESALAAANADHARNKGR